MFTDIASEIFDVVYKAKRNKTFYVNNRDGILAKKKKKEGSTEVSNEGSTSNVEDAVEHHIDLVAIAKEYEQDSSILEEVANLNLPAIDEVSLLLPALSENNATWMMEQEEDDLPITNNAGPITKDDKPRPRMMDKHVNWACVPIDSYTDTDYSRINHPAVLITGGCSSSETLANGLDFQQQKQTLKRGNNKEEGGKKIKKQKSCEQELGADGHKELTYLKEAKRSARTVKQIERLSPVAGSRGGYK